MGITDVQYPGIDLVSTYTEKLEIGYRWYDAHDVEPLYPFGHGLSYTEFYYTGLWINGRDVNFIVENVHYEFAGKEVVQIYVGFPEEAGEPPKQLKQFKKISLDKGGKIHLTFTLTDRDLSIWDVETHAWKLVEGDF